MVGVDGLLVQARERSGLSRSELARRVGTSRAALHDYERGTRLPRVDGFLRVLDAAGVEIRFDFPAQAVEGVDLAEFVDAVATSGSASGEVDGAWAWRSIVSDFIANEFVPATRSQRKALVAAEPVLLGDDRWDSLVGAVAEHLAWHGEFDAPLWAGSHVRLRTGPFWWPVHGELASMRAAAMAHSPAAFRRRCINIDGRELPRVTR